MWLFECFILNLNLLLSPLTLQIIFYFLDITTTLLQSNDLQKMNNENGPGRIKKHLTKSRLKKERPQIRDLQDNERQ